MNKHEKSYNQKNHNVAQQPFVLHQQYYLVHPTQPAQPAYIPQLSQNQELAYTNLLSQITQVNTKILDDGNQDESEIFQNILINKNKSLDILNSKIVIEEEDIIIDNLLSSKTFYVYNEFLKTSPIFKSLFSDDVFFPI